MTVWMVDQLSAISLECWLARGLKPGLPGCPRGALAPGGQRGAEGVFGAVVGCACSLVHGGGGALRRKAAAVGKAGPKLSWLAYWRCRQAWFLVRRSDSPVRARVYEPCSNLSMMASAMVGSPSH